VPINFNKSIKNLEAKIVNQQSTIREETEEFMDSASELKSVSENDTASSNRSEAINSFLDELAE
jgi:hypothetical protein